MTLLEILKIIGPIIGGFLGVGGIGAYYAYKSARPKTDAEAKKINAEVVVTFAEGWKNYAEKLETRLENNETEIARLRDSMEKQDEKYRTIIRTKDAEIAELQEKNRALEHRVDELETQLEKHR